MKSKLHSRVVTLTSWISWQIKRRTHWKKSILTDSWRARTGVGKCALTRCGMTTVDDCMGCWSTPTKLLTDTNAGKQAMDVEATREAIRQEAPAEDVKNWVYDQLGNVLGQKGIRNGKDRFTPAGIKRSFASCSNSTRWKPCG